jgi:predicted enzyme related to lactoylglutathione lyase
VTLVLREIVFECGQPAVVADFWGRAFGWQVQGHDSGALWMSASGATEPDVLLVFAPRSGAGGTGNRLRLYTRPAQGTRHEEVARLISLGARRVAPARDVPGWTVLADPEGNEFGVLDAPPGGT